MIMGADLKMTVTVAAPVIKVAKDMVPAPIVMKVEKIMESAFHAPVNLI